MYASNFSDSGMYVGACLQVCDVVIDHAWMEYSALGYSGTNSGGAIIVKNSEFDNNTDGFDTNTQLEGDPPAPQNGACPGNTISPITHTHSCWVFMHNNVHDNNNSNVPRTGNASEGPAGTGMTISGGRNDTVMDNTFSNNGAWGVVFLPFPDPGTPSLDQTCSGTGGVQNPAFGCVYDAQGNALLRNTFSHNAFFANPSNADYAQLLLNPEGHRMLPRQHRPRRERARGSREESTEVWAGHHRRQHRFRAARAAPLRHRRRVLPSRLELPDRDRRGHETAANQPEVDAQPMQGSAQQRLVRQRQARIIGHFGHRGGTRESESSRVRSSPTGKAKG